MDTKKVLKLIPVFLNFKLAIRIWWKNLSKFAMIYVWGLAHIAIPAAIFFALFWLGLETNLGSNAIFIDIFIIIGSLAWFFILYYLIRLTLSLFLLIKHEYLGHEFKIYQESARYFWSYLLLQILFWLTLALWFLVFFIPALIFFFYSFELPSKFIIKNKLKILLAFIIFIIPSSLLYLTLWKISLGNPIITGLKSAP